MHQAFAPLSLRLGRPATEMGNGKTKMAEKWPAAPERGGFQKDAACLLTVGSFLLTVELFYLQLTILAFFASSWNIFA